MSEAANAVKRVRFRDCSRCASQVDGFFTQVSFCRRQIGLKLCAAGQLDGGGRADWIISELRPGRSSGVLAPAGSTR